MITSNSRIPEEVLAEVSRKNAQVEFNSFQEAVNDHFQDARSMAVYVREDPDEDDRNWVVFEVALPRDISQEEFLNRHTHFCNELIARRPHIPQPICVLSLWYATE